MNNDEMNKFMLWLLGAFPSWKPDKGVSVVWAGELPDVTANDAMAAVRVIHGTEASPFPPGVFEIKGKLSGRSDPRLEAKIVFNAIWTGCSCRGSLNDQNIQGLVESDRAQKTLRLIGGGYGQSLTAEKDWHEKRFVDVYCGLAEREAIDMAQLPGSTGQPRRITTSGGT